MYVPRHFALDDPEAVQAFVHAHDFATVVTGGSDGLVASHVPVLLDATRWPAARLRGHLARGNPQWRAFDGRSEVLVVFPGPHAYVSPAWYETAPAVPTWNYATVHVHGVARAMDDRAALEALLGALIARHEGTEMPAWRRDMPADFWTAMVGGIVGFEVDVTRVEAKFKLGQNRPEPDRIATVRRLARSDEPGARALARLSASVLGLDMADAGADGAGGERSSQGG